MALVECSKHGGNARVTPFDYAHIALGLKIGFPRRYLERALASYARLQNFDVADDVSANGGPRWRDAAGDAMDATPASLADDADARNRFGQGRKRERNSQLQSLISRPFSPRFG